MNSNQEVALSDIRLAHNRIAELIGKTPLLKAPALSELAGIEAYLKLETINEVGSFKIRGAANKMLQLTETQCKQGVTTYSTGNHGMAVAFIARELSIPAVICISNRVPHAKVAALQRLGAKIEIVGDGQDDAAKRCQQLQEHDGLTVIPPFDDRDIIAGQGTIALEILEDLPGLEEVIIPVSGGGLIAGIGFALKQLKPDVQVTGVSIQAASAMHESLREGKPIEVPEKNTIADSLLGGINLENHYTFTMVQQYMDQMILLSDRNIVKAMTFLMEQERIVAEGAGAAGVAAVLTEQSAMKQSTVILVTGNNLDWQQFYAAKEEG
ncbi:pyridoxal-phosphate dependent enzyme [Sediminibacillus dalangtanensis]|uniref:Pyridoxal-phosphate dependent enzyme n=1 Tax=Sediminibacillus dalangtanensis TaxID=2729421 RepID=A0ABX7VSL2_9BACI|nr:pyridoxal-phosphate dependent enzyme [Sediminibacillus dalangtanensis]QTM98994.1 pyridoxal-phosphate dependent enzyme [Sediminibacillus dalangtanensis]